MAVPKRKLYIKESNLPDAGNGLFTGEFIPKGEKVIEYKGKITTWKEVDHQDGQNGYIYFVKRDHVIDAGRMKSALARYANDARGIKRIKGLLNNAEYVEEGVRVFIQAARDIQPGEEIFVPYGKEYWEVIRYNRKLEADKLKKKSAKKKKRKK